MDQYITDELPKLVGAEIKNADMGKQGIFGHSMGGHGAITLHLKYPDTYKTCSAFSPITSPARVPWGQKAFTAYLGPASIAWEQYDSTELVKERQSRARILVDTGTADTFLEKELKPEIFIDACMASGAGAGLPHARRLRPRLLLHRHLHGRPHRPSCGWPETVKGCVRRPPVGIGVHAQLLPVPCKHTALHECRVGTRGTCEASLRYTALAWRASTGLYRPSKHWATVRRRRRGLLRYADDTAIDPAEAGRLQKARGFQRVIQRTGRGAHLAARCVHIHP